MSSTNTESGMLASLGELLDPIAGRGQRVLVRTMLGARDLDVDRHAQLIRQLALAERPG